MEAAPDGVTQLLINWRNGDKAALDQLTPLVYEELRRLARGFMRKERSNHTLQTSALINEAYLRLADQDETNKTKQIGRTAHIFSRWQHRSCVTSWSITLAATVTKNGGLALNVWASMTRRSLVKSALEN